MVFLPDPSQWNAETYDIRHVLPESFLEHILFRRSLLSGNFTPEEQSPLLCLVQETPPGIYCLSAEIMVSFLGLINPLNQLDIVFFEITACAGIPRL